MVDYRATKDELLFTETDPDREHINRQQTLRSALRYAQDNHIGAVGLVELVDVLGLGEELDELIGFSEVQRIRVAWVREQINPPLPVSDGS